MARRNKGAAVKAAKRVERRKAAAEVVREGDWGAHLTTLRQALEERKPDALQRIRTEIMALDDQITKLIRQSDLAPKTAESQQAGFERGEEKRHATALDMLARRRAHMPTLVAARVAKITAEIEAKSARVQDLSTLVSALRAEPFAQDYGGTPETVTKARDWLTVYETKGFKIGHGTVLRITSIQRMAGQELASCADRTQVGIRSCMSDQVGSGSGPSAAMYYGGERAREATQEYANAIRSMGMIDAAVVIAVAVAGTSIPIWSKRHSAPEEAAFKALDRGLSTLAKHYMLDTQRKFA